MDNQTFIKATPADKVREIKYRDDCVIIPENMSNEEIVSTIKRLALILRDRTANEIQEIRRKKALVDAKLVEMRQRLYKARAEANAHLTEALMKVAKSPEYSSIVKIDKNGAIRISSSVVKQLGGITETPEVKRYQRMVDALLTASERYREQLKALGQGAINIHPDHIYIRLPKQKADKVDLKVNAPTSNSPKIDNLAELVKAEMEKLQNSSEPSPENSASDEAEELAEQL